MEYFAGSAVELMGGSMGSGLPTAGGGTVASRALSQYEAKRPVEYSPVLSPPEAEVPPQSKHRAVSDSLTGPTTPALFDISDLHVIAVVA